jgi:tetratricopeptide (TPR) repeat protein
MAAGHWQDALLKAELALQLPENAHDAELPILLAQAAAKSGQWERARDAAQRAIAQDDLDPARYVLLAQAERALGHPDQALAALDRAQALTPFGDSERRAALTAERLRTLALRREQQVGAKQWGPALATVESELALAPSDPERLAARLTLLEAAGRAPEALALARQLTAQPTATASQWLARARLARALSDDDAEVSAALDAAARLAPADPALAEARGAAGGDPPRTLPPTAGRAGLCGAQGGRRRGDRAAAVSGPGGRICDGQRPQAGQPGRGL